MDVNALEQEIKEVKDELKGIKKALSSDGLTEAREGFLTQRQLALLARLDKLENVIQAMTPTTPTTPAPAPPGNSITLPQVLPLASFLSSPSFFRTRFVDQLQLTNCGVDDEGEGTRLTFATSTMAILNRIGLIR